MSIFTILVQGSSMPALLAFLGITRKTPVQMQHLLMAAKEVEEYANRNLSHLKVGPLSCLLHACLTRAQPCVLKRLIEL